MAVLPSVLRVVAARRGAYATSVPVGSRAVDGFAKCCEKSSQMTKN